MKKYILFLTLSAATCVAYAQPSVEYTYDPAGNRIQRNIIVVGGMALHNGDGEQVAQQVAEMLPIEDEGDILINLYPNPTQADVDITIDYQNVPQQVVTMSLYDASGKLLESKQVSDTRHQISLQKYPTGIYYLRMSSAENRTMKEVKILRE
jgi:hypothetical protein